MVTAVYGCLRATKWVALECLSTTTMMTMYPRELGSASMKSIDNSDHMCSGIGMWLWQTRRKRAASSEHGVEVVVEVCN
jgi:hypothetical protein